MSTNYIVLRNSPDWLSFDPETSRAFCRSVGLPESLVIEFMSIWDRALDVDFRRFRHEVKCIAVETFESIRGAVMVGHQDFRKYRIESDDLIFFTDDDDWASPHLFSRIAGHIGGGDGARWGSIRVGPGPDVSPVGGSTGKVLLARAIDDEIYTNNYALSGGAVNRLGLDAVLEHWRAMQLYRSGGFAPTPIGLYLSVANKQPCCALSARFLLEGEDFRKDPRGVIVRFAETLDHAAAPDFAPWVASPLARFRALVNASVGR